jgi:CRP-like cAMP-binding protein
VTADWSGILICVDTEHHIRAHSDYPDNGKPLRQTASGKPVRNIILLQIPEREFLELEPHLEFIELNNPARLEQGGHRIGTVYFLNDGIGSMIVEISDGRSVEVGLVGYEGMIGLQLAAGLDELTYTVIMQVKGNGFHMPAAVLQQLLPRLPELQRTLLRRLAIRSLELAQNAACNRLHNIKQRLARWLLLTHDRLDSDLIRTTHDFLSRMVGTDRPSVSLAVADFERDGIIRPGRGSILIADRRKLEQRSCECYGLFHRFNAELGLAK